MYSRVSNETWLRGVQVADADGKVAFTTIVPGCYSGRWPHIHFEVYPEVDSITDSANAIATSQVALRQDVLDDIYAQSAYDGSAENLAQVSLANDNVFATTARRCRWRPSAATPTVTWPRSRPRRHHDRGDGR